jgi:hypothetical protein
LIKIGSLETHNYILASESTRVWDAALDVGSAGNFVTELDSDV